MNTTIEINRRLSLEGCPNFRDIGGYPCSEGKITRRNRFYRADCLSKLTDNDVKTLTELGIRTVIDLRHADEILRAKNKMDSIDGVAYRHISLADGIQSEGLRGLTPESLWGLYIALVDEAQTELADIFRILLTAQDGAVVFHCTAGKDRTGVVAAILLLLAGADERDVIEDYAVTYGYMRLIFERQLIEAAEAGYDFPAHLLRSDAENMDILIRHLTETYGGAEQYLEAIGLSRGEINLLKHMLTEDAE
jgi:protein-tyrosine phosphatase